MYDDVIIDADAAHGLLAALEQQLGSAGQSYDLVVASDLNVPAEWLNSGPAEMLRLGLPDGFETRWTTQRYGPALTVRWASRVDQIHFKLYAAVDQAGKHLRDLEALEPQRDELIAAARWSRQHDPSEGFLEPLRQALAYFGVEDVDLGD